jgi:hypothetical protein
MEAMDATLIQLAAELSSQGLSAAGTGAIGISTRNDGAYLGCPNALAGAAQLSKTLIPEQRVVAVMSGQDPRPLYVIPWIPEAPDSSDLTQFREKIRAQLLSWLGNSPVPGQMGLQFRDLLASVTRGVSLLWRDRESLEGKVFATVGKIVRHLFGDDARCTLKEKEVRVTLDTSKDREDLMEQVRTARFADKLPEGVQLSLSEESPS